MSQWINFAELRARVSLEDVIFGFYKIENLKRDGPKVTGPCPVHGGDSPRAFSADLSRNVWHCFTGCQAGGNQLDFVAKKEGISIRDAALKLQAHFFGNEPAKTTTGSTPTPASGSSPGRQVEAPKPAIDEDASSNKPLDIKLELKGDHPHLVDVRKLKSETVAHFAVGYASRGIMKGTIALPIHDEDGELVAYGGRRLKPADIEEFGKWKFPKGFRKELVLYNFHRAKEHLADHLILVEGFFSVMKLHEMGFPNVVASMGCSLSEAQARLLAEAKEVIVLYDGNDAGWKGAAAARDLLAGKTVVRLIRLPAGGKPAGYEPEDLSARTLRWAINGLRQLDLAEMSFVPVQLAA
jgi:DNA primase